MRLNLPAIHLVVLAISSALSDIHVLGRNAAQRRTDTESSQDYARSVGKIRKSPGRQGVILHCIPCRAGPCPRRSHPTPPPKPPAQASRAAGREDDRGRLIAQYIDSRNLAHGRSLDSLCDIGTRSNAGMGVPVMLSKFGSNRSAVSKILQNWRGRKANEKSRG